MIICDESKEDRIIRISERVAPKIQEFVGVGLKLELSHMEVKLSTMSTDNSKSEIYHETIIGREYSRAKLQRDINVMRDVCEREEYNLSKFSRLLLYIGYVPSKLNFSKTN